MDTAEMADDKPKIPRFHVVLTIMGILFGGIAMLSDIAGSFINNSGESTQYFQQGTNFERKGDYENAIIYYRKEIDKNPEDAAAYNALSWLYIDKLDTNYKEAVTLAQTAVKLTEQNKQATDSQYWLANYLDTLGWAHYKNGDLEESITALEKAVELDDQKSYKEHLEIAQKALTQSDE